MLDGGVTVRIPATGVPLLGVDIGDPAGTCCAVQALHPTSALRGFGVDEGDAIVEVGGVAIDAATHTKSDVVDLLRQRPLTLVVVKGSEQHPQ